MRTVGGPLPSHVGPRAPQEPGRQFAGKPRRTGNLDGPGPTASSHRSAPLNTWPGSGGGRARPGRRRAPGCCTHTEASPRSSTSQIVWSGAVCSNSMTSGRAGAAPARPAGASTTSACAASTSSRVQLVEEPLDRPSAHALDHGLQVLAGGREVVLAAATGWRRPGLEHALALEVAQALGEQRSGRCRADRGRCR